MKSLVKKSESGVRVSPKAGNYKVCGFGQPDFIKVDGRKIYQESRTVNVVLFEKSPLTGKEDFGYSLPVGSEILGNIETRYVETYELPDNRKGALPGAMLEVNTFTTVVKGDSTSPSWEATVRSAFKARGHNVIDNSNKTLEQVLNPMENSTSHLS